MSRIGPREPVAIDVIGARSLADLLWLANTAHGPAAHWFARPTDGEPDHDHLRDPVEAARYLTDHRVAVPADPPTKGELAGLTVLRDMVRGLPSRGGGWTPAAAAVAAGARLRLGPDGHLRAEGAGWTTFIWDLVPPLVELVRRRDRLAICENPTCRLVFLDASRSGTRRWCDDGGCGNRIRLRRHRAGASATA